jgi:hypothetical protein
MEVNEKEGFMLQDFMIKTHPFHKMWACCNATLDSIHLKITTVEEEMKKEKKMRMSREGMKKTKEKRR